MFCSRKRNILGYNSVKCSGKNVILKFDSDKDACVFVELFTSPKTSPKKGENIKVEKIVQDGKKVTMTFLSEQRAKLCAAIMEYPKDYTHPLETYGKRCKSCSY